MSIPGPLPPTERDEEPPDGEAPPADPSTASPRRRRMLPWMTFILIGANLAVAVGALVLGGIRGSDNTALLIFLGAKVNSLIQAGDFWRLVTAGYLHIGLSHLLLNMLGLLFLGSLVEAFYGRARYLIFYTLTGAAGMALSYMMQPQLSAGASASIFGLAGVMMAHNIKYRAYLPPAVTARLSLLAPLILVQIALGFLFPLIDLWGHVGGLLAGLLFGAFSESRVMGELQGEREWLPVPAAMLTAAAMLVYAVLGFGLNASQQWPLAMGAMAETRGSYQRAASLYQAALRTQPDLVEIRLELARLLLAQGRPDEARAQYLEVIRRHPDDPALVKGYLRALMDACEQLSVAGRWHEVADRYREALRVSPDAEQRALFQNDLAYVLANNLQDNLDEALQLAEAATTTEPGSPIYLDTKAWVLYRLRRMPEAEQVQQTALRQPLPRNYPRGSGSDNPVIRYHMGAIWEAMGKKEQAIAEYRAAIDLAQRWRLPNEVAESLPPSQAAVKRLTGEG
jgi:rhomboid protease GluP